MSGRVVHGYRVCIAFRRAAIVGVEKYEWVPNLQALKLKRRLMSEMR